MTLRLPSDCYIQTIEILRVIFGCPPDWQLTPEHIREVPSVSVPREKAGRVHRDSTVGRPAFFYTQTIKRAWSVADTPYPKEDTPPGPASEPGRSGTTSSIVPDSVSSHGIDDALWHGGTARRVGSRHTSQRPSLLELCGMRANGPPSLRTIQLLWDITI